MWVPSVAEVAAALGSAGSEFFWVPQARIRVRVVRIRLLQGCNDSLEFIFCSLWEFPYARQMARAPIAVRNMIVGRKNPRPSG